MAERKVLEKFDAEKVHAEIADRERAIAEQQHLVNWLDQAHDEAERHLDTLQWQLVNFTDTTHEPGQSP